MAGLKDEPRLNEEKIPILKKPTSDSNQGLQKQKSSVSQKKVSIYEQKPDQDEKDSIISEEDSAFEETPAAKKRPKNNVTVNFTQAEKNIGERRRSNFINKPKSNS